MKPVPIISLIVLSCLVIGFYQHSRLEDLKTETTKLERSPSGGEKTNPGSSSSTATQTGNVQPVKSLAEIEAMMVRSFEAITKSRGGSNMTPAEQAEARAARKLMFSTFASLDHQAVSDLIAKLEISENLPAELRDNIAAVCWEILMEANPKEAIGFIQMSGDSPTHENEINQVFNRWANANPGEALRWFEEESKKGNPVTDTAGIRKSAMLVQARVDPSQAMSHEQLEKLIENPDESNLGASIAATLNDARENSAFLAALRHQQEKLPGSANLAKIRQEYIRELSGKIDKWTFEEASLLIDSEFSPSEKLAVAERISHVGDLAEPSLWVDWFSKIDAPKDAKHPLYDFVMAWMRVDPVSAGKWLNQDPPGDMKDRLVFNYAFVVVDSDPAAAMQWIMKIPEEKLRARAFKEVSKK